MRFLTIQTIVSCGLPGAFAQTNTSAKYGAGNPYLYASKNEPAAGAPSGTRLQELFRRGSGGEGIVLRELYLLENLKVEIGTSQVISL
jgi:hypothetical protein